MKKLVVLFVPLLLLAAEPQKKKSSAPTKPAPAASAPAKPAAAAAAVTIPADAKEIAPHVWRAVDAQGKAWIYRQTPFGLSKVEDRTIESASGGAQASVDVKATDLGDTVRFEKPMPMGNRVWTVKKSELSDLEKTWFEQSTRKSAGK